MIKQSNISNNRAKFKQSCRQGRQSFPDQSTNKVTNIAAARGRSKVIPITADHSEAFNKVPSSIPTDGPYTESDCRLLILALRKCSQQEAALITKRLGLS